MFFCLSLWGQTNEHSAAPGQWVTEADLARLVDPASIPKDATVQVELARDDNRLSPAECPAALFSNSENRNVWGRTLLKVQCLGSEQAPFFVQVDVQVWAPVLVVKESVQSGQEIKPEQVEFRTMDIAALKQGWISDLSALERKTALRPLWPGMTLSRDNLKGQPLLKYGDTVKVMIIGPGFQIAGTAMALEAAEKGDIVKIKTDQGKVLHGVAVEELVVEVTL